MRVKCLWDGELSMGRKAKKACGAYSASRFIRHKGGIFISFFIPEPYAVEVKEVIFMQKRKTTNGKSRRGSVAIFGTLKVMVAVSLLIAMSIVCGKYLAFGIGNVLRFSFENLPVIISGMLFGPVVGAVTGIAADLIGCIMVGYAINPLITLGAAIIGGVSGTVFMLMKKRTKFGHGVSVALSVAAAHVLGSVLVKTVGLSAFYDMPFIILLLWRLFNYAIVGGIETVLIYYVTKNKSVISMISNLKGGGRK